MTENIEEIKEKAIPVAIKYGIAKMALFGSYVNGTAKENSDYDFIIELGNLRGLQFFSFIQELEDVLKKSVDVLTYDNLPTSRYFTIPKELVLYEA